MNVQKKSMKDDNVFQPEEGCCGGPAPAGVAACCIKDAEAKAIGEAGCGCGTAAVQASTPPSACCGTGSLTLEEISVANAKKGGSLLKAPSHHNVRQAVRQQYGRVAAGDVGCGSGGECCDAPMASASTVSQKLGYTVEEVSSVPAGANMGLGCGNPQAIANLKSGETVLDLGSGGTVVYFSPGLRLRLGGALSLRGQVQIPALENLHGVQDEKVNVRTGLVWTL
jgi:hypothetical protein